AREPVAGRASARQRPPGAARAQHAREPAAHGGRDGPHLRRREHQWFARVAARLGPGDRGDRAAPRRAAGTDQVRRLRLVERAHAAGTPRSSRRGTQRRCSHRVGAARRRPAGGDGRGLAGGRRRGRWRGADVEVEGDETVQQAVRFGLFHAMQAGARAEQRAIPAKGLTGPGYDGHAFWDTEMFVLPALTATAPHAAADALLWRYQTLD